MHDDIAELLGHGIGVRLELTKSTLVLAMHPHAEVGTGQRRQHGAGFIQTTVDRIDQRVDVTGQLAQIGVSLISRQTL